MPWSLEIHHIDVTGTGDATLIIARDPGNYFRSCLIDGGHGGKTFCNDLTGILATALGGNTLDVMVCTHYDKDHINGLRSLLLNTSNRLCDTTRVYDQGWPAGGLEETYEKYVFSILGYNNSAPMNPLPARNRVTAGVLSGAEAPNVSYELRQRGAVPN